MQIQAQPIASRQEEPPGLSGVLWNYSVLVSRGTQALRMSLGARHAEFPEHCF